MAARRIMKELGMTVLLACALSPVASGANIGEFVTQKGDKLWYRGKEYRAIGVNAINLHLSYARMWLHDGIYTRAGEDPREMMLKGLDDARDSGFKFVRFFAHPGYPVTIDRFYFKDKEAYWKNMDAVVEECRRRDLKLVPSLSVVDAFTHYHGEPKQAILDPASKGHRDSYRYIEEFVTRYQDEPTILMWEIHNELMLEADVKMAGRPINPGLFTGGKAPRSETTIEDTLSYDQIVQIYREMAGFIKRIDKNHLVTSGDAKVRMECTSRREKSPFRTDTLDERISNNINSQPAPLDVYSLHMYQTPMAWTAREMSGRWDARTTWICSKEPSSPCAIPGVRYSSGSSARIGTTARTATRRRSWR